MYWLGLITGLLWAYMTYQIGVNTAGRQQRLYGKAVAYRLCTNSPNDFCTAQWLGLPENVRELPFEALSNLP